jgi:hypothetical protein
MAFAAGPSEGSSLRGIRRTSGLAYNAVVRIVRAASQPAQLVHKADVQAVQTKEVSTEQVWQVMGTNEGNAPIRHELLQLDWAP